MSRYNGGKNGPGTYHTIINLIPKIDIYIELFAGSAAIGKKLLLPPWAIFNELSRKQYEVLKTEMACSIVINSDGVLALRLYRDLINKLHREGKKIYIYCDPPYPRDTRSHKKDIYEHEWTDEQHRQFLQEITLLECYVMVSSYRNSMYNDTLAKWNTVDFQSMTRKGKRTETLYFNYPDPEVLQDTRYTGKTFRDRDLEKRRVKNFISKFQSLAPSEQSKIRAAIG